MKYTFDNFLLDESNEFAYELALAVAEFPGSCYNPVLIHGASAYGKTHLVNAIKHAIEEKHQLRVEIIDCDKLVEEWIIELKKKRYGDGKSVNLFKRFADVDVVIIEDIQCLYGKDSTQDEIGLLTCELIKADKQVIYTSTKGIESSALSTLRFFHTRWPCALEAFITMPGNEMKGQFLDDLLEEYQMELGEQERGLLIRKTITRRQMEAILKQAQLHCRIENCDCTEDVLRQVFKERRI